MTTNGIQIRTPLLLPRMSLPRRINVLLTSLLLLMLANKLTHAFPLTALQHILTSNGLSERYNLVQHMIERGNQYFNEPRTPSHSYKYTKTILYAKPDQRYSSVHVNDEYIDSKIYDTIVIGDDLSGLTVASLLLQCQKKRKGKELQKVLVLSQQKDDNDDAYIGFSSNDNDNGSTEGVWQEFGYEFNTYNSGIGLLPIGEMGSTDQDINVKSNRNLVVPLGRDLLDAITPQATPINWHPISSFLSASDTNYLKTSSTMNVRNNPIESVLLGNLRDTKVQRYDVYAGHPIGNINNRNVTTTKDRKAFLFAQKRYHAFVDKAVKVAHKSIKYKTKNKILVRLMLANCINILYRREFNKYSQWTVKDVVDNKLVRKKRVSSFIRWLFLRRNKKDETDATTRALALYLCGRYRTSPGEASWLAHAITTHQLHRQGTYYPAEGPSVISKRVKQVITARGGIIEGSAPVQRVIIDNNRIIGVQLFNGTKYYAQNIVSSIGYTATTQNLIPVGSKFRDSTEKGSIDTGSNVTTLSLYIGLPGNYTKWRISKQSLWLYPTHVNTSDLLHAYPDTLQAALLESTRLEDVLVPVHVVCPSALDPSWSTRYPQRTALEIHTIVPRRWFEFRPSTNDGNYNLFGGDNFSNDLPKINGESNAQRRQLPYYEVSSSDKQKLAQILWSRARQALLSTGASMQLPARLTNADFYRVVIPTPSQSVGLEQNRLRFDPQLYYSKLRPYCMPGLYLSSSDIAFGDNNLISKLMGGYLCAAEIMKEPNPWNLCKKVQNNRVVHDPAAIASYSLLNKPEAVFQGIDI